MTTFSTRFVAIKRKGTVVFSVISVLLITVLVILSFSPAYNILYYFNELKVVNEIEYSVNGGERQALTLPRKITGLKSGDVVSVYLESSGRERDNILVEVDHAKCVLSLEGAPYFSVGSEGTYPEFQKEPPSSIDIVPLPNIRTGTKIQADYTISEISNSLKLRPFYFGDQNLITKQVLMENYLALILSLITLVIGATLAIVGLVFFSRAEMAIALFWLGLGCLACGTWAFFSNNVVLLSFSQFSSFYNVSLVGLFVLPLPMSKFCITFVRPYRMVELNIAVWVLSTLFIALLISHITGFVSFGEVESYFSIVAASLLVVYVVLALFARQRQGVALSPLFIIGMALFALLNILDVAADYLGIETPSGVFSMVGLLLTALVVALLVWEYVRDALDASEKNARLEADISAINRSLDLQRKHFGDYTGAVEETRRMRHDLRHQLVALQGFISEHKEKEALEYIDKLSRSIPSFSELLICDNVAVNALAVYCMQQAESEQIYCDIKMAVPIAVGRVPSADLSIIVGNLLENALEACRYVEPEKRFIKVRSNVHAKRFTLVIDNSFDGELKVSGNSFFSRKRNGHGVGIASVRSVVQKYDGSMKYEAESGVFKTSLYVKI